MCQNVQRSLGLHRSLSRRNGSRALRSESLGTPCTEVAGGEILVLLSYLSRVDSELFDKFLAP